MSTTLSYGYILPATGDRGSVFFPALEDNITRLNSHNHDGVNSAALSSAALSRGSTTILAAAWVSQGGGTYRQEVTLPTGYTFANTMLRFEIDTGGTDGHIIYPSIELGTAPNKYYVYINDNTLQLIALCI